MSTPKFNYVNQIATLCMPYSLFGVLHNKNGHVRSENGILDLDVRMPKSLGGANDDYSNPEMLFATSYSACFDSLLNRVIKLVNIQTGKTTLTASVNTGQIENGVFCLLLSR